MTHDYVQILVDEHLWSEHRFNKFQARLQEEGIETDSLYRIHDQLCITTTPENRDRVIAILKEVYGA